MIAYYEAHPDEIPAQPNIESKSNPTTELKIKHGFRSKDVVLAAGISFGATFLVITVLYLLGAVG